MLRLALPLLFLATACNGGGGGEPPEPDANLGDPEFTITNTDASGVTHSLTITCEDLQISSQERKHYHMQQKLFYLATLHLY